MTLAQRYACWIGRMKEGAAVTKIQARAFEAVARQLESQDRKLRSLGAVYSAALAVERAAHDAPYAKREGKAKLMKALTDAICAHMRQMELILRESRNEE